VIDNRFSGSGVCRQERGGQLEELKKVEDAMKKIATCVCFFTLGFAHLVGLAQGQPKGSPGKISGYMFGDYYYVAANHDHALEDRNGFWFRRIYFTYDQVLSEAFALRFRLEFNSPGDFKSGASLIPYVKDAYLKWTWSRHSVLFGVSPTPTWEVVERMWDYRSMEKTPLDLQKFGTARDFGVAFLGSLDKARRVNYHVMFANGSGVGSETDKGKKLLASLGLKLTEWLLFEAYGDWEERPGRANRSTLQAFLAYQTERFRTAALLARQNRELPDGGNAKLEIGSVFAVGKLASKTWAVLRLDRNFDPNPEGATIAYIPFSPRARSTLAVAGMDYTPIPEVHLIPNVELVYYDKVAGTRPTTDVIPRLTLYYLWK